MRITLTPTMAVTNKVGFQKYCTNLVLVDIRVKYYHDGNELLLRYQE